MHREDDILNSVVDNANEKLYNPRNRMEGVSSAALPSRLLTTQEICELLKVSKTYIYWLTHQKKIPYIKMQGHLRFRQSDIDEWLMSQEVRIVGT